MVNARLFVLVLGAMSMLPQSANASTSHRCAANARARAADLLSFHVRDDLPNAKPPDIVIGQFVRKLPSIRNPANRTQHLDVLEVFGSVDRGEFRVRLVYIGRIARCVLVGQEVLNWGSF